MWKVALLLVLLAVGISLYMRSANTVLTVPKLPDTHWGPESTKNAPTDIRPFKIDVPSSVVTDLKDRLARRRKFVEPLENAQWTYGISTKHLETVLDYWQNEYNWTERQRLLNKYPQFMTNIQGLDIHYYHVRPNLPKDKKTKVLPLLMVHGWPGSVVEFQKIIPMLTTPRADQKFVFEVIAPSLPGYGFSSAAVRPGLAAAQIAVIFQKLMLRLGYEKYYVQGGDWGAVVVSDLAVLYPNNVIGVHSNMCSDWSMSNMFWLLLGTYFPSLVVESEQYSQIYPLRDYVTRILLESGYFHIQATKPDTIGTALSASPEGLAAYILEKFSTWTNKAYRDRADGGLLEKFTLDEILDNIMVYWVTNTITTSCRLYAEMLSKTNFNLNIEQLPVKVPTACANFPHELVRVGTKLLGNKYQNLVQSTYLPRGGHFAAFEEPDLLANDVFTFVQKVEGIVEKKA